MFESVRDVSCCYAMHLPMTEVARYFVLIFFLRSHIESCYVATSMSFQQRLMSF